MIGTCPRCNGNKFEKLDISGVSLDRCLSCKGIWFDGGEFEKVVEFSRKGAKPDTALLSPPQEIKKESYHPLRVRCPGCDKALLEAEPVNFEFIHHVVVADRCNLCGSVWLDASELSLIFVYLEKEDAALERIAESEVEELKNDAQTRLREEVLENKVPVGRRGFWRVLLGMSPEE